MSGLFHKELHIPSNIFYIFAIFSWAEMAIILSHFYDLFMLQPRIDYRDDYSYIAPSFLLLFIGIQFLRIGYSEKKLHITTNLFRIFVILSCVAVAAIIIVSSPLYDSFIDFQRHFFSDDHAYIAPYFFLFFIGVQCLWIGRSGIIGSIAKIVNTLALAMFCASFVTYIVLGEVAMSMGFSAVITFFYAANIGVVGLVLTLIAGAITTAGEKIMPEMVQTRGILHKSPKLKTVVLIVLVVLLFAISWITWNWIIGYKNFG